MKRRSEEDRQRVIEEIASRIDFWHRPIKEDPYLTEKDQAQWAYLRHEEEVPILSAMQAMDQCPYVAGRSEFDQRFRGLLLEPDRMYSRALEAFDTKEANLFGCGLSIGNDAYVHEQWTHAVTVTGARWVTDVREAILEAEQEMIRSQLVRKGGQWGYRLGLGAKRWPGDARAIRTTAAMSIPTFFDRGLEPLGIAYEVSVQKTDRDEDPYVFAARQSRNALLQQAMHAAELYWLPGVTGWSVCCSQPLSDDDRAELSLSAPTLVLFEHPLDVPAEYLSLPQICETVVQHGFDVADPDQYRDVFYQVHGDIEPIEPALVVRNALYDLPWEYLDAPDWTFPWKLAGVVLMPTESGTLSDAVAWVLEREPDAENRVLVHEQYAVVEGVLSGSTLAPIAEALAAYVTWGTWVKPDLADFVGPETAAMPARKRGRTAKWKKAERLGLMSGVNIVDARHETPETRLEGDRSDGSRRTHYRRGHWRRSRVGPRHNWRYVRRRIAPTIVNATPGDVYDGIAVYRLPPPVEVGRVINKSV